MSTPWTERHGGLWLNRATTADELVSEKYDSEHDAFILIWRRAYDGYFMAEYLVKGKANSDPQWSLPFWGNIAGQGIFGTLEDAQRHLRAIANDHRQKTASA
jgi:hypothetical protein